MDLVRFLIGKAIIIAIALSFLFLFYFLATLLVPQLPKSIPALFSRDKGTEIAKGENTEFYLPTPRRIDLTRTQEQTFTNAPYEIDENYVPGNVYTRTVSYDASGNATYSNNDTQVFDSTQAGFQTAGSAYIRGLSIYPHAYIFSGMAFTGEARETFFVNERFIVYLVNMQGALVGSGEGISEGYWSTPGWNRFTAHITQYQKPSQPSPCRIILQQNRPSGLQEVIPVTCR